MAFRILGVLVLLTAAFAVAFRLYLGSKRLDWPRPGISSFLTVSGMLLIGAGLVAYGHPNGKLLIQVGAWDYAIGAMIALYKIRQRRTGRS